MYEIFQLLMEQKGVSVADVSRETGIGMSTFSNWKKRNSKLSAKYAKILADYFDVTVGFLMGENEDRLSKEYFTDAASAQLAQEMFQDDEMRVLFHVKKNINYERFRAYYEMLLKLYQAEHPGELENHDFRSGTDPD